MGSQEVSRNCPEPQRPPRAPRTPRLPGERYLSVEGLFE